MAKTLIAIPTLDRTGMDEMTAMWAAKQSQRSDIEFSVFTGRPVDFVRNSAIRIFLKMPQFSHIFFLDSDVEPSSDCIDRLLSLDVPLASGLVPMAEIDGSLHWMLIKKKLTQGRIVLMKEKSLTLPKEPFEVDSVGGGCLLIRRDVFDKINWPWFKITNWLSMKRGKGLAK